MPEEISWSKVRNVQADIRGIHMEENIDNSDTDTIPIPLLDVERKTLPVFCPWCDVIVGVAKSEVVRFSKIFPAYKACRKCRYFINEGMFFIRGRSSSLTRWLLSFCRQMLAFKRK